MYEQIWLHYIWLVNMLVTTEETLKSSRSIVLAVEQTSSIKRKSDWKKKIKSAKKEKKETGQRRKFLKRSKQRKNVSIVMLKAT